MKLNKDVKKSYFTGGIWELRDIVIGAGTEVVPCPDQGRYYYTVPSLPGLEAVAWFFDDADVDGHA